ncbi:MAG: hypothetical protein GC129_04135 [Proteobacteria bacterium]|nr:hypothetical protein [Pseudomonadota bacterium]
MAMTKLLMDSVRLADGGKVVCDLAAPDGGVVHAVIETSFFEDFMGMPEPRLSAQKQSRIVRENAGYLENEADRLWKAGNRELVIR